uniref:Uncharacterized protein n=1 Tax=Arundo donax TaxID=35708 RepID=A0A0A8ZSM3_ARUDO
MLVNMLIWSLVILNIRH